MSQKVTVTIGEEEEEEEVTFGKVVVRIIVWGLIAVIFFGALGTAFLGEDFILSKIVGPAGAPTNNTGTGGGQSTEGDGGPAPTPVPSGDNNPNIQPTAAVILPTPLPTLTPWVYPAPVQPTQPPPQVESPCAHIEGDIVWVEVHGAGLTPKCFSIYSWQRIGVVSLLDAPVQVTLEDTSMQLAARARSEFSEPVASMLTPGMHLLRADPYGSVEVWLVVR